MAISATLALTTTTLTPFQATTVSCTITNTGTTAATLTSIQPYASPHSQTTQSTAVALGNPALGPGQSLNIPGALAGVNGTLTIAWLVVPFSPAADSSQALNRNPTVYQYDLGAAVYVNDPNTTPNAVVANPAVVVLTVQPLPGLGQPPAFNGQIRFDVATQSAFVGPLASIQPAFNIPAFAPYYASLGV